MIGTRPEAIKVWPLVVELQGRDDFEVQVLLSGQHRELLHQAVELLKLPVTADLEVMQHDQTLEGLTARLVERIGAALAKLRPDCVIVQGDTTTVFIAALAAFYAQIPVGHLEAGLRTDNIRHPFPEEMNRRLTSVLADWHFAPTETARAALLRAGVPDERIWVTGNSVIDALRLMTGRLDEYPVDPQLETALAGTAFGGGIDESAASARAEPRGSGDSTSARGEACRSVDPTSARAEPRGSGGSERIIAVTVHRRENQPFMRGIAEAFARILREHTEARIVFPVHLSPAVRAAFMPVLANQPRCHLLEPLDYANFVRLLTRCHIVLSDSGGVQEEAPYLGKPVLVMRRVTERPEAVEAGTVRIVGEQPDAIVAAVAQLLTDSAAYEAMARAVSPYGDGHACPRIAEILAGQLRQDP